jgi:hypothetical protein
MQTQLIYFVGHMLNVIEKKNTSKLHDRLNSFVLMSIGKSMS